MRRIAEARRRRHLQNGGRRDMQHRKVFKVMNMPYIKPELRKQLEPELQKYLEKVRYIALCEHKKHAESLGQLNSIGYETIAKILTYSFFKTLKEFYEFTNWYYKGDVDKILCSVQDEFHRRCVHPHEDTAKQRNGDI
jgi:hypothetical protein